MGSVTLSFFRAWMATIEDLGDGIRATRLLDDLIIIPGLWKLDGYTGIRRLFSGDFEVIAGTMDSPAPVN